MARGRGGRAKSGFACQRVGGLEIVDFIDILWPKIKAVVGLNSYNKVGIWKKVIFDESGGKGSRKVIFMIRPP